MRHAEHVIDVVESDYDLIVIVHGSLPVDCTRTAAVNFSTR